MRQLPLEHQLSRSTSASRSIDTIGPIDLTPNPNPRRGRNILNNHREVFLNTFLMVTYLVVYTVALSAIALGPTVVVSIWDRSRLDLSPDQALVSAAEIGLFEDRIWPAALGLILILGLHFLQMSMRMLGPIPRIEAEFERAASGDLRRRIVVRQTDNLAALCRGWNTTVASLDEHLGRAQSAAQEFSQRFADLERAKFGSATERFRAIELLAASAARVDAELAVFQTSEMLESEEADDPKGATTTGPPAFMSSACESPDESVDPDQAAQA